MTAEDGSGNPAGALARRITAGDAAAEGEFYALFRPTVAAVLRRRLNRRDDVEDVLHEVFLIVLRKLRGGEVEDPERVGGFLFATTRNCAFNANRKARRDADDPNPPDPDGQAAPGSGPMAGLDERQLRVRIGALLDRLPESQSDVLRREFLLGQGRTDIAEARGISMQAVSNLRHRALQNLLVLDRKEGLLADFRPGNAFDGAPDP